LYRRAIRKAVIPAAGLGTRFLPATKAQPKEMLPIVDKPAIQYIVEEAVRSGIESLIIATGHNKKSIEDHFDRSLELERTLLEKGKHQLLREVRAISDIASIHFIRQKEPLGLGHAVWCARQFIGDEPFGVMLGDDIMVSEQPALRQLISVFKQNGQTRRRCKASPAGGRVQIRHCRFSQGKRRRPCRGGARREAFTRAGAVRFSHHGPVVLHPTIFPILETLDRGAGGEFQLTDALHAAAVRDWLLAVELVGSRYDIGDNLGYMKAILEIGLQREELSDTLLPYLKELVRRTELGRLVLP